MFVLFFSCTTKEGKILAPGTGRGNLWVTTSNFQNARIFLDYRDQGKRTPALLENIPNGPHIIHVFRGGTRPTPDSVLIDVQVNQTDTVNFVLDPAPHGKLVVDTDPDSARVFLNRLEFGLTPLRIDSLPEGNYFLEILKSNYDPIQRSVQISANDSVQLLFQLQEDIRNRVLIEHFTNSGCPPCVEVDELIDDLAAEYGDDTLLIISYHAKSPDPGDPMYQAAQAFVDSRWNFYNALYTPRVFIGGQLLNNPQNAQSYHDLINNRLRQDTVATIAFQALSRADSTLTGDLEVKMLKELTGGTVLHIVLIEDSVDFETAPGINGQKHFTFVMRDFFPDAQGQALNLSAGSKKLFHFQFEDTYRWETDLTVVAFLQETNTKRVLQAAWTRYPRF
ncbi:MAG: hypothetical protein Kow0042_10930 [Calditrichia bacterium]